MSKGDRNEKRGVAILQSVHYATYRPATVRYGENDVWGLFDILAIHPELPMRGIQVKSNSASGVRRWMRATSLWRAHGILTEFWVPVDRQGWRVLKPTGDGAGGFRTVYDEADDADVGPHRDTDLNTGEGVARWLESTKANELYA